MLLLAFFASYLLIIYSGWLKKYKFVGNIAISLLVGLLFIAGPLIAGNIYGGLNLAILAGVLNWAREILKDIEEKKKEQFILAEIISNSGAKVVAAGLMVLCVIAAVSIGTTLPKIKAWMFYLAALIWVYGILRILSPHQAQKAIKYGMGLVVLGLLLP
jgi:4-hydroxybenzoate polyprenyltransferase